MTDRRSVVLERDLPFAPDRVWRAITTPELLAEWLMPNDFAPVVGQAFRFTADWGGVDCRVLDIEPGRMIRYAWAAFALDSEVTITLTPIATGTRLRLEQVGFADGQVKEFHGARAGWGAFLDRLAALLPRRA